MRITAGPEGWLSARREYGAKGDGITDDTAAIQRAIDAASAQKGIVRLPPGKYRAAGTITWPAGTCFRGESSSHQDYLDGSTVIYHDPTTPGEPLFRLGPPSASLYCWGVQCSGLTIVMGPSSGPAILAENPGRLRLDELCILGGTVGIDIAGGLDVEICGVKVQSASSVGVIVRSSDDFISTTVTLRRVHTNSCPIGVQVQDGGQLGIRLDQCILETALVAALDLWTDASVDAVLLYTENVPSDGSAAGIIKAGLSGTPLLPGTPQGRLCVVGGPLAGYNGGAASWTSCVVDCDVWGSCMLLGCDIKRVGSIARTTANSGAVTAIGGSTIQVHDMYAQLNQPWQLAMRAPTENGGHDPHVRAPAIELTEQYDTPLLTRAEPRIWSRAADGVRTACVSNGAGLSSNIGGALVVADAAGRPTTGNYAGRLVYQQDTKKLLIHTGSAWVSADGSPA